MTATRLALAVLCAATAATAQEPAPPLAGPDSSGIALRWAWPEGERPAGYFVERREANETGWTRLTPQPLTRSRDRTAARARLGGEWGRYEGLLFPEDPRAERADPESYRALLLLAADVEPAVAHLLALRYDDGTARPGSAYAYRLVSLTSRGETIGASSGAVVAAGYTPSPAPDSLHGAPGPSGIALRWRVSPAFTAYHVYRGTRRDGGDARRINTAPVVVFYDDSGPRTESAPTFFADSTVRHADSVFYQLEGIDAFGRRSRRSPAFGVVWRNPAAPAPPQVQASVRGDTVILSWIAPPSTTAVAWQVWRADQSTGPFERLGDPVPAPALEYLHAGQPARRLLWYRVTAIDGQAREGDPSAMALAEVRDLTPPQPPQTPEGTADTGRLRIDWARVPDRDLLGYRVYRAFAPDGTFGMLTASPLGDTTLTDTIPAAADHPYYFRVTAVDSAWNESAPSPVLQVRPPDVRAPSAPRITAVRRGDRSLQVEWLANPEPDVVGYRLRHRAPGGSWIEADSVSNDRRSGNIPGLGAGQRYEVSLIALDDAGNASPPAPSVAGEPTLDAMPAPELRRAAYQRASRAVLLEWTMPAFDVVELLVLRREGDGVFRPVGAVSAGETSFTDPTARAARRYEYALQARDRAGRTSESRPRRVTTPERSR